MVLLNSLTNVAAQQQKPAAIGRNKTAVGKQFSNKLSSGQENKERSKPLQPKW